MYPFSANTKKAAALMCILGSITSVYAQEAVEYGVTTGANLSTGLFAPYFISALNHGKITQKNTAFADVSVIKEMDYDNRFSWGFGAEMIGDAASENTYALYSAAEKGWVENPRRPSAAVIQQLYLEMKYRSLFLQVGMKEHTPALMNPELSSGDFVESGNARPIPEIRAGFFDFVDIPFTNGWLQIQCQLAYGKMTDHNYIADRYNYYNNHIASNTLYNYKSCLFRTNPDARFMATFGMQSGGFFGGKCEYYRDGELERTTKYDSNLSSFINMLIPGFNSKETFNEGSSLGSWDFYAQYSLNDGSEICAYFQWPIEDGSGVARRNKLDGVWGLEFINANAAIVSNIVVEYIDYRDQSGPIHYAPGDYERPTLNSVATGRDNYYNNDFYNAYANYGMSIGTPFLLSPIYNLDGYPGFLCNRANGMQVGISGFFTETLSYKALFSYQRGMGNYDIPYSKVKTDTSLMLEMTYNVTDNLSIKAQIAGDKGDLRGDNFGGLLSLTYRGTFDNKNRR